MINPETRPTEAGQEEGRLVLVRQKTGNTTTYLATSILTFDYLRKLKIARIIPIEILIDNPHKIEICFGDLIDLRINIFFPVANADQKKIC